MNPELDDLIATYFRTVPQDQQPVAIHPQVADESDPGPYPIPPGARVEGGSDHHVLIVQQGTCKLFELFSRTREGRVHPFSSYASWLLQSGFSGVERLPLSEEPQQPSGVPRLSLLCARQQR